MRSDVPATTLARMAVGLSDGLQLQWIYDKEVDIAEGLSLFVDVLLQPPRDA